MLRPIVVLSAVLALSAIAAAQNQCQLECTRVTKGGETKVTRSCHNLNAAECAKAAKSATGGQTTCRGYMTTHCVNN